MLKIDTSGSVEDVKRVASRWFPSDHAAIQNGQQWPQALAACSAASSDGNWLAVCAADGESVFVTRAKQPSSSSSNSFVSASPSLLIQIDAPPAPEDELHDGPDRFTSLLWVSSNPIPTASAHSDSSSGLRTRKKQSNAIPGSDTTFLLSGSECGFLRVFALDGQELYSAHLHSTAVLRIRPSYSPSGDWDGILVLFEKAIARLDVRQLIPHLQSQYNALSSLSSSSAAAASKHQDSPPSYQQPAPVVALKYSLSDRGGRIADIIECSCGDVSVFDTLQPSGERSFLTVGRSPMIASHSSLPSTVATYSASKITSIVASKVTSAVFSLAKGFFFGGGSNNNDKEQEAEERKPPPSVEVKDSPCQTKCSPDDGRTVAAIWPHPAGRLAAMADAYGRVILLDATCLVALKVWKGYRDAHCVWIRLNGQSSITSEALLAIYTPRRGLLEVWDCIADKRLGAANVGTGGALLPCGPHYYPPTASSSMMGSSMMMRSSIMMQSPSIPASSSMGCVLLTSSGHLLRIDSVIEITPASPSVSLSSPSSPSSASLSSVIAAAESDKPLIDAFTASCSASFSPDIGELSETLSRISLVPSLVACMNSIPQEASVETHLDLVKAALRRAHFLIHGNKSEEQDEEAAAVHQAKAKNHVVPAEWHTAFQMLMARKQSFQAFVLIQQAQSQVTPRPDKPLSDLWASHFAPLLSSTLSGSSNAEAILSPLCNNNGIASRDSDTGLWPAGPLGSRLSALSFASCFQPMASVSSPLPSSASQLTISESVSEETLSSAAALLFSSIAATDDSSSWDGVRQLLPLKANDWIRLFCAFIFSNDDADGAAAAPPALLLRLNPSKLQSLLDTILNDAVSEDSSLVQSLVHKCRTSTHLIHSFVFSSLLAKSNQGAEDATTTTLQLGRLLLFLSTFSPSPSSSSASFAFSLESANMANLLIEAANVQLAVDAAAVASGSVSLDGSASPSLSSSPSPSPSPAEGKQSLSSSSPPAFPAFPSPASASSASLQLDSKLQILSQNWQLPPSFFHFLCALQLFSATSAAAAAASSPPLPAAVTTPLSLMSSSAKISLLKSYLDSILSHHPTALAQLHLLWAKASSIVLSRFNCSSFNLSSSSASSEIWPSLSSEAHALDSILLALRQASNIPHSSPDMSALRAVEFWRPLVDALDHIRQNQLSWIGLESIRHYLQSVIIVSTILSQKKEKNASNDSIDTAHVLSLLKPCFDSHVLNLQLECCSASVSASSSSPSPSPSAEASSSSSSSSSSEAIKPEEIKALSILERQQMNRAELVSHCLGYPTLQPSGSWTFHSCATDMSSAGRPTIGVSDCICIGEAMGAPADFTRIACVRRLYERHQDVAAEEAATIVQDRHKCAVAISQVLRSRLRLLVQEVQNNPQLLHIISMVPVQLNSWLFAREAIASAKQCAADPFDSSSSSGSGAEPEQEPAAVAIIHIRNAISRVKDMFKTPPSVSAAGQQIQQQKQRGKKGRKKGEVAPTVPPHPDEAMLPLSSQLLEMLTDVVKQ